MYNGTELYIFWKGLNESSKNFTCAQKRLYPVQLLKDNFIYNLGPNFCGVNQGSAYDNKNVWVLISALKRKGPNKRMEQCTDLTKFHRARIF